MPPPLEQMDLTQTAILWEIVGYDRNGMPTISAGVEIPVRWEEGNTEMVDTNDQRILVDVSIASNRNIKVDSLMWEGSIADLNELAGTGSPPPDDLYQVVMRIRAKDILGRYNRYEFGLKRYKDRLPEVVA